MSQRHSHTSRTPSHHPVPHNLPAVVNPPLHTDEHICGTWDYIRLSVRGGDILQFGSSFTTPDATGVRNGLLQSNISAHGRLYLTTSRLVFDISPAPPCPQSNAAAVSFPPIVIPLAWLPAAENVLVQRPFFDVPHVSVPFHPSLEHTCAYPEPDNSVCFDPILRRDFASLLLYPLRLDDLDELQTAIINLLADRTVLASNTRALRHALRQRLQDSLVPTQEHFAFVDPDNPRLLHLATQMTYSITN